MSRQVETIVLNKALEQLPDPGIVLLTTADQPLTPQQDPKSDAVHIKFSSGNECFIKREWYDRYEVFRAPIIFREYANYQRWIYPLLNKQSLRFTSEVDTPKELGAFLEEVYFYHLEDLLTDGIIQDIADNSGLTKSIIKIKKFITKLDQKKNSCFNNKKKYVEEIDLFKTEWLYYIELLAVKYKNDKYKKITADLMLDTMRSTDFLNLCVINMKYNNLVFEFCDWFDEFIMKHNHEKFTTFKMNLSLRLADSVSTSSDIGSAITGIIQNISGSTIDKNSMLSKIGQLTTMKELMK